MGSVLEVFHSTDMGYQGVDAVVHLAAIPSPGQTNSSEQFRVNTMSSYNVLEACRKLGIKNVVMASSETLIGIPFDPHPPEFLPITEENERRPESAYSLSKLVGETMAEQYVRWDPTLKIISLRFSNVMIEASGEYESFESWQDDPKARYWNW
jgi:nucleoside-diphosphate-sugar epimerase